MARLHKIVILGAGFAGSICAAMLSSLLPEDIELTLVDVTGADETDAFFGTVTSPSTYDFLLGMGISEPDIFPNNNTAFSLGTHFENWGPAKRSWTQSFHRPLPNFQNVEFQHYLTRMKTAFPQLAELQPYIMSVHAARRGVFAHPPEDKNTPLSNMQYGYQFLPHVWRDMFLRKAKSGALSYIKADLETVERSDEQVTSIKLSNGQTLRADFYIDALGQHSAVQAELFMGRHLNAAEQFASTPKLGLPCRKLAGRDYGWQADTPLQDGLHRLTVFHPDSDAQSLGESGAKLCQAILGYHETPWTGNILRLGHGAACLEPLTPAPVMMLQRDIERLMELIPLTADMQVEAREYNRRFNADYEHATMFHRALFEESVSSEEAYWSEAKASPLLEKLTNKLTQFKSRGIAVQYDLEPFSPLEWIQLHLGMSRLPQRYDPLADRINQAQLADTLRRMRSANETMANKMPPHHVYMTGLLKYLRTQNG